MKFLKAIGIIGIFPVIFLATFYYNEAEQAKSRRAGFVQDSTVVVNKKYSDSLNIEEIELYLKLSGKTSARSPDHSKFISGLERKLKKAEAARTKLEAKEKKEAAQAAIVAPVIGRKNYGLKLRDNFLDKGLDIKVSVSGDKNENIKMTFPLFNDVWAHRMQKDGLLGEMKALGFKKVTLTDNYDYTVYWNFDRP